MLSESLTWEWTHTTDISIIATDISDGCEDYVSFTAIPQDVYVYTILDSPTDPEQVGTEMTITVPRACTNFFIPAEDYNASNGPLEDIVLPHTKGNPSSYPSTALRDKLTAASGTTTYISELKTTPKPSLITSRGELKITISSTDTKTFYWDQDFSAQTSIGTEACKAVLELGFGNGYTSCSSTTAGTEFGGTVGCIPDPYYKSYKYSSGLFVYKGSNSLGQSYWIIEYWVEK